MMSSFERRLHSEYRSTYRWHEYRGGSGAQAATQGGPPAGDCAPAPPPAAPPAVVRRAPLPSQANPPRAPSIEPAMPRRKKYPGLAYKTNEIFEAAAAGLPSAMTNTGVSAFGGAHTLDRARSMERTKYLASRGERRSKSEGPRTAQTSAPRNWTDTVEEKATSPSIAEKKASTEYRNQFAWPRDGEGIAAAGGGGAAEGQPRKSASMGALKAAQQIAKKRPGDGGTTELEPLMNHVDDNDNQKKYIEDFMKEGDAPAVHRKITFRSAIAPFKRDETKPKPKPKPKPKEGFQEPRKGYKSEYKKKFRPFSHYVYEASKGTFTKCRELKAKSKGVKAAGADAPEDPAQEKMLPKDLPNGPHALANKDSDSWYREVLDLRKRAGEYKYRGWGTELAPEHITEIYSKQMELWYQVSRRSSLSALSLATTNHRAISKEEKENENKSKTSPKKPKSFKSAPHQSIHAKLQETRLQETPAQKSQRKKLQGHSFDNTSVSEGKTGANRTSARTSPRKQLNLVIGGRGSSVEPTIVDAGPRSLEYRSPKRRPRSADPKPHQPISNGPLDDKRRPSKPSDEDVVPLRSGSAFRDPRLLDDSPVVKSPPEPTRVKSPEQMNMRSPDPVNWTVPLDTGKTFTVTQNVKSDDLMKRPGSDFKGTWGADDQHSTSISAPLETDDGTPRSLQQELASVHQPTKLEPPKSMDISPRTTVTNLKQAAKTPTSPPNLTPIDEMKVLDITKPVVNGGGSSGSETHPSPVAPEASRVPGTTQVCIEDPTFEMATLMTQQDNFKPTEATQKSHGGVDTSIVSPTAQASVAAEVLEKARTRFDQFWGKKEGGNDSV
ncbi:uncharacterized protein LOC143918672 isoform X2 [Arctopsyche grandis]|uniref:uncharacterized protein LOC143918672 isoform X2 n=1 Tax=Arctopsyche grandis TaxID=121162 RepID=UPI00406D9DCA